MKEFKLKPISKYILEKIKKADKKLYPIPSATVRFYSYLATLNKELVKTTVAVKTIRDVFYHKQVAVHGIHSGQCHVRDIEYSYYTGMGFKIGWYDWFLYNNKKSFEDGKWYPADRKYYNPYSVLVNVNYLNKFPEYKYSEYRKYNGKCILEYLRVYEKYPQVELLLKAGISSYLATKITLLKKLEKDKDFRKFIMNSIKDLTDSFFSVKAILSAYKHHLSIYKAQRLDQRLTELQSSYKYNLISEKVKDDWIRFFDYLDEQNISHSLYYDYLYACDYIHLDMSLSKNLYPKDFKRWHDIRIDEYHTAKTLAEIEERKKYMQKFIEVANKYLPLQRNKKENYICLIAKTPEDLIKEGEFLNHCVGRMNYDQKMAKEQSLIFFIRSATEPEKPFVTLEYSIQSHKVLQCYGYQNSKPTDDVLNYVKHKWLPYANKQISILNRKINLASTAVDYNVNVAV